MLSIFVCVYEIGIGDTRLFDRASKGTYGEFFMERNDATSIVFS